MRKTMVGVLVAANTDTSHYGRYLVTEARFRARMTNQRLTFELEPIGYDSESPAIGGLPVDEPTWNPFNEPHPYTGCLYFDWFVFFSNDGREFEWDGYERMWGERDARTHAVMAAPQSINQ